MLRPSLPGRLLILQGHGIPCPSLAMTFSPTIRFSACALTGFAALVLALGALLVRAASVTGASNYSVAVSWVSAIHSAVWPPSWQVFVLLLGTFLLAAVTLLIFFRAPRGISVSLLVLEAGTAFYCGGALGTYFISRELELYHFSMDAEKLGEHWFIFEAAATWSLATLGLAVIRLFAGKR